MKKLLSFILVLAMVLSVSSVALAATDANLPSGVKFTITFDAQGGTVIVPKDPIFSSDPAYELFGDDKNVYNAFTTTTFNNYRPLPTAERAGYTFDGWFTAPTGGDEITIPVTFDSTTTVYAHWTPATTTEYTITFDGNGGTASSASATTVNHKLASLPDATYDGHTFKGWYDAATGGNEVTIDTVFTSSATVYAQWMTNTVNPTPSPSPTPTPPTSDDPNPSPSPTPNPGNTNPPSNPRPNHNHNHNTVPEIIVVEAPKTGDASIIGYTVMAILAAAGAMGSKRK